MKQRTVPVVTFLAALLAALPYMALAQTTGATPQPGPNVVYDLQGRAWSQTGTQGWQIVQAQPSSTYASPYGQSTPYNSQSNYQYYGDNAGGINPPDNNNPNVWRQPPAWYDDSGRLWVQDTAGTWRMAQNEAITWPPNLGREDIPGTDESGINVPPGTEQPEASDRFGIAARPEDQDWLERPGTTGTVGGEGWIGEHGADMGQPPTVGTGAERPPGAADTGQGLVGGGADTGQGAFGGPNTGQGIYGRTGTGQGIYGGPNTGQGVYGRTGTGQGGVGAGPGTGQGAIGDTGLQPFDTGPGTGQGGVGVSPGTGQGAIAPGPDTGQGAFGGPDTGQGAFGPGPGTGQGGLGGPGTGQGAIGGGAGAGGGMAGGGAAGGGAGGGGGGAGGGGGGGG